MKTSKKRRTPARAALHNLGSLITYEDQGIERCLGYLLVAAGHGVFEPTFGRVDVIPGEAELHNRALSAAEIKGLDETCEVGQGAVFYPAEALGGSIIVSTWTGDRIAEASRTGQRLYFRRSGKTFVGRGKPGTAVFFKRAD
ncbi:hypothetical protein [Methylocaldum sp.]|jgi:hypothetical protein|uniref:hypothetical protein n=1 Tax=unclassified Methylocaldum TaxID=2622260 RepID=UPI000A329CB4